ncbi:biotin transporter BioY [Prochlorococcus marinus]|nr:biotin transporter BioY [Prochlorococcus marinus]
MSLQIPSIIIITLIFKREVVIISYSIYLLIGLFFLPIFQNGGSVGYILTPNFGYLLGIYPLINIINKVNKINRKIHYYDLLRYGVLGICSTHIIGIIYSSIQILYFKQPDTLIYNISKYSFGKFFYHLLMLIPITLLSKFLNIKYRNKK